MRHVEHPQVGDRAMEKVKYLLACRAAAAHTVGGPILRDNMP